MLKGVVDAYKGGEVIPCFEIRLKLKDDSNPQTLEQKIGFKGIQEGRFIVIKIEPKQQG